MMRRAIFLDRDGVLNRPVSRGGVSAAPAVLDDWHLLPGVPQACRMLHAAGFLLVVVTNQPDVARGIMRQEAVEILHSVLARQLPLDEIRVCYHDDDDQCYCRKPQPGLLLEAAAEYGINLRESFLVGDRAKDIEAGNRAGCRTVLIADRAVSANNSQEIAADHQAAGLAEAACWILEQVPRRATVQPRERAAGNGGDMAGFMSKLKVKLFADGADRTGILKMSANPLIQGFTTNPTLMRKAGVADYRAFAQEILRTIADRPISFEVFADDFDEMEAQALEIASWGENVYVKVPVSNTQGRSSAALLRRLSRLGVKLNVTALTTLDQVQEVSESLVGDAPGFISVFAGRIADTGRDPIPLMAAAVEILRPSPNLQLIWASPRELLNIFHADAAGCHVITVTNEILSKLALVGKDLREYSLETVQMFYRDAQLAGYKLETSAVRVK